MLKRLYYLGRNVEVVYIFPLGNFDSSSTISKFEIKIGNRVLKAEIKEKNQAFHIYDDHLSKVDIFFSLIQFNFFFI